MTALLWQKLIASACQALGEGGAVRVYAAVPEDDQVALHVFRQVGFQVFVNDVVFRRSAESSPAESQGFKLGETATADAGGSHNGGPQSHGEPNHGATTARPGSPPNSGAFESESAGPDGDLGSGATVVEAESAHAQALSGIHREALPESARIHESPDGSSWANYPAGGWSTPRARRVVVDRTGAVMGAWFLHNGAQGRWLHFVAAPATESLVVRSALSEIGNDDRPLYCAARGYEASLNLVLRESGFEPFVRRFRLVKHTAARVIEPNWQAEVAAERRLDPAPTRSVVAGWSETLGQAGTSGQRVAAQPAHTDTER